MNTESIVREVIYPHPPERVWIALTESDVLAQWLLPNDFEARLGHHFIFTAAPREDWNGIVECEVMELEEPYRLVYTWNGDPTAPTAIVTFTLSAVAMGTRVRLEHTARRHHTAREIPCGLPDADAWLARLSHVLHFQIDEVALTDALCELLGESCAWSLEHPLLRGLEAAAPDIVPVLESMAIDGVAHRPHVAHYVHASGCRHAWPIRGAAWRMDASHGAERWPGCSIRPCTSGLSSCRRGGSDRVAPCVRARSADHTSGRHVLARFHGVAPDLVPLLEHMILDGVTEREHVAAYVRFLGARRILTCHISLCHTGAADAAPPTSPATLRPCGVPACSRAWATG